LSEGRILRDNQHLGIAGVRFAFSREPLVRLRAVNSFYWPFLDRASENKSQSTIAVRLRFDGFPPLQRMKRLFATGESWSMYRDGENIWITMAPPQHAEPLWIARFDRRVKQVTLFCRPSPTMPGMRKVDLELPVAYPLDQLLLMYYFAGRRGMLLHGAGMVREGKAYLFVGASGAGKSTFSQLLAAARVGTMLSDERMIVRGIAGGLQAFGTPWAGTAAIARDGSAPLAGIFFLRHGRENGIEKLAAAEAMDRMLPLVSIPWYDPDVASPIIAFAKRVVAATPCHEFSFTPDRAAIDLFRRFLKKPS
jgi:hypothetical protein